MFKTNIGKCCIKHKKLKLQTYFKGTTISTCVGAAVCVKKPAISLNIK